MTTALTFQTTTFNVVARNGQPWLAFAVQGGDSQDQNLLQFFLNVVEFGMTPQQASEAPNMNSFQLHDSFADHPISPGKMLLHEATPVTRGSRYAFLPFFFDEPAEVIRQRNLHTLVTEATTGAVVD